MFGKDLLIKKYPYLAYSSNLMECFLIIGYNERFVPQIIRSYKTKENLYPPTILSSVISESDFCMVDNKLIISQIYPENPLIIMVNKNDPNQEPPPSSNVIYSFCFDSTNGKSKIFYACYGYKFYERYKYYITETLYEEYFIPKAFCIISQYYYFTFFFFFCQNLIKVMSKRQSLNSLPIELTIYNIVNFVPSPMNYKLHLDLFASENCPEIELSQLSGYPYIDFDLKEVFRLLPINLFLEIYFFALIEQPILFFSSNLEILNMVMFIIYVLQYPWNDCTYFWHIISVSKNNFNEDNKFVGKSMFSLLGVNMSYNESFDSSAFGNYHFIVDIDNKKMTLKQADDLTSEEEINDFENLNELYIYIQNIIREKKNDHSILRAIIWRLKYFLEQYLSKNTDYNPNQKIKYVNFFKMSENSMEINQKIQEFFYHFSLNILIIFYQDFSLSDTFDNIEQRTDDSINKYFQIRYPKNEGNIELIKEERIFLKLMRDASKYNIYFVNFIQMFESIDVYKIPLFFSEEFINVKMKDGTNSLVNRLSIFKIIDALYLPNEQTCINITFSPIENEYYDRLKPKFNCFFTKEKLDIMKNTQLLVLNKKILAKYIYLLKNLYLKEEIKDLIPSIRIQETMEINYIDRRSISDVIQNSYNESNLIEPLDYLFFSLAYIFSILIPLHSHRKMIKYVDSLVTSLGKIKLFLRQHIFILMKSLYKYYIFNREKKIYPHLNISNIKMYIFMFSNMFKDNYFIPNEEIMTLLKLFFTKLVCREKEELTEINLTNNDEKYNINRDIDLKVEPNKNFMCFIKYCFNNKKVFSPSTMINSGLVEKRISNIIVTIDKNKTLQPLIQVKINDYTYKAELFSVRKIYKISKSSYMDFFEKSDLDINHIKIENLRDIITNFIQYGLVINKTHEKSIPIDFFIDSLYSLKDFEKRNFI